MKWTTDQILAVLDQCCDNFTFPMLDNGYVYLSASRMSAFWSPSNWAIVIEIFGFSPRSGLPDTQLYVFGSRIINRKQREDFSTQDAYENFLKMNPNNESHFIYPIEEGFWIDPENSDMVAEGPSPLILRGKAWNVPTYTAFSRYGVDLEEPPRIQVFELCRVLAATNREDVLATPEERKFMIPDDLKQVLQLEEWNHPDVVEERPPAHETFQQLANVLVTGDPASYKPTLPANTHWKNWPDGGSL